MQRLIPCLRGWPRVVLLFSGGLDSSLLLALGKEVLGEGLTALTFSGPHTAPGEVGAAWQLSRKFQVRHLVATFDPLHIPDFRENTPKRCYVCKQAMLAQAQEIAADLGAGAVWDGTNLDDLEDFRPGLQAAREAGVESPLLNAGLGKQDIRELSRKLGLPADKPAQSCLATRFPYHTTLSREALARVGRAEAWLRARGLAQVRLRVRGRQARLELAAAEWPVFWTQGLRRPFLAYLNSLGFEGLELAVPG
ncbi:MAG: ATP-dependent sacrificial sulfur transferase LarE [Thermodesulfobacteriota bacterium]